MPDPRDKREPRSFEPPPWERDQFEKLQADQPRTEPPPAPEAPKPEAPAAEGASPSTAPAPTDVGDTDGDGDMSEAEMDAMLIGLGAEEGPPGANLYGCGLTAAIITAFVGVVVLVFGIVAYLRTAQAGFFAILGPMILTIVGIALIGLAGWLAIRTLRRGA